MADRYCRNCGHEFREADAFCPGCGKPVQQVAHVPVPEADVGVPPRPQETSGTSSSRGGLSGTAANREGDTQGSPWYQRNFWIIVLLIFFFPAGLYLMWKHAAWSGLAKGIVTTVFALMVLGSFFDDTESATPVAQKEPAPEQQAETTEETTAEVPSEDTQYEPPPKPPASELKNRIRYNLSGGSDTKGNGDKITVETGKKGCKLVTFDYTTPFVGSTIPSEPSRYYEAVYGDKQLLERICLIRTNAHGDFTDKYGNTTRELVLTASMGRETAKKVNWKDTWSVDFESLQKVEYVHPSVEANIAQEAADQAVDCIDDGGLFDFDWAECP